MTIRKIRKIPVQALSVVTAAVLAAAMASASGAQRSVNAGKGRGGQYRYTYGGGGVQQQSPVQITHQTLKNAAQMIESALPIYDGHRHHAIALARLAEQELREAVMGARGARAGGAGNAQRLKPAQRAAQVPKHREVATARYSAQQVQDSNARMQQGIQLLQQGIQQLQSLGRDPANHVSDAAEFAGMAAQSANQGLQYVANRR